MMHKAWSSIEEVPYCFARSSVKFQNHTALKIVEFDPIGRFRTVTPVWIHQWVRNAAQSFKQHRRGALSFSKVIHQISRSHQITYHQFRPELSISGLYIQFECTNGFEMMHKAWCSIEEVPYCFSRSSIKFHGHTGGKIDDLNPIWDY